MGDGGGDEKAEVKVGNKNETVGTFLSQQQSTRQVEFEKKKSQTHVVVDFDPINQFFPFLFVVTVPSLIVVIITFSPSSRPLDWVYLVSPRSVELWCSTCIVH